MQQLGRVVSWRAPSKRPNSTFLGWDAVLLACQNGNHSGKPVREEQRWMALAEGGDKYEEGTGRLLQSSVQGKLEILHLYLRPAALLDYAAERSFKSSAMQSLRYIGGFSDPLLEQMGRAILAEMRAETTGGSLLVESLCGSLTARLLHNYSNSSTRYPRYGCDSAFEPIPLRACVQGLDRTDAVSVRQCAAPGAGEGIAVAESTTRGHRTPVELLVAGELHAGISP
jgi:hypothetical protein